MSKSKFNMTPSEETHFEEKAQGDTVSSLDDWEFDLGERILHIENLLEKSRSSKRPNAAVISMLSNKLVSYNAAIAFLQTNPKAAIMVGGKSGLKGIIEYVNRAAQEDATRDELKKTIDRVKVTLPGYKLRKAISRRSGGLSGNSMAAADVPLPNEDSD